MRIPEPSLTKNRAWLPDLLYTDRGFVSDRAIVCDAAGSIVSVLPQDKIDCEIIRLPKKAILPGMINAHSHAFQRVIRGRAEYRRSKRDSFWTWREMMYEAANSISPEGLYTAARMTFLEMALSGITTVGEFHYLHNQADGGRYDDPNLLAKQVISAALSVGIRIALLRVAYVRAGFQTEPNPRQARFIENDVMRFLGDTDELQSELKGESMAWVGLAPHSVRAVPLGDLRQIADYARGRELPLHMHVAEQPAELDACLQEYGLTPVSLLADMGILNERFTAVHAVHISPQEVEQLSIAGAMVCACPTTERNLGDGILPVDRLLSAGIPVSLGTDSNVQIDILEDARELEYHLRLSSLERGVLDPGGNQKDGLARRLFECATLSGARSLGFRGGSLEPGNPADFFSVDLMDPAIAGASAETLLPAIVFSSGRSAVRDVVINGEYVVENGVHHHQERIVEDFAKLQRTLWT